MDNITQALHMAFAVLIFIIALAISLTSLNQAKKTADVVLYYSDRDSFQEYVNADESEYLDGGRTVGTDTVIATLLRCTHENYAVRIIDEDGEKVFDYSLQNHANLKNSIDTFVNDHISDVGQEKQYRETYREVTLTGITYTGNDGTTFEENVGKKIYITYNYIS